MDKWVLITGSSRGIGKACAQYLAKNGYNIVLHCSSDIHKLNNIENELLNENIKVRKLAFDINNRELAAKTLLNDVESNGIYYGIILNAGINSDAPFPAMDDDMWDKVVNTNLNGFYNILKPIIMHLIQNRCGRIITMSSISGLCGNKGQVNYSASKAGIIGATKALSLELAKRNIMVNCIAPGIIKTDMTENLPPEIIKQIPVKRMGSPSEVASLANYLLSEDASYITGQVISVNGGLYL